MESGSQELARQVAAYATSVAFGLAFLLATFLGCDGGTALFRGVVVAIAVLAGARILAVPVVRVVLDALARDTVARQGEERS